MTDRTKMDQPATDERMGGIEMTILEIILAPLALLGVILTAFMAWIWVLAGRELDEDARW